MNTKKLVLTALMVAMFSGSAAFAGPGGKGNGNGNGNGGGNENSRSARDNGRNSNGAVASELKWRNAGHASAQAFSNANEDSAVGQLATLKNAAQQAVLDLYAEAGVESGADLRDPSIIADEIQKVEEKIGWLDPDSSTYDSSYVGDTVALGNELDRLEAELALPETLDEPLELDAEATEIVGIGDLSEPALEALWALLEGK